MSNKKHFRLFLVTCWAVLLAMLSGCTMLMPISIDDFFLKSDSLNYKVVAENVVGSSRDMTYMDGCLLFNNLKSDNSLTVFDLSTKKVTQRFLKLGQESTEKVDRPTSLNRLNDSTLVWLDSKSFVQEAVLADDKRSIVSTSTRCQIDSTLSVLRMIPLADGSYVTTGFFNMHFAVLGKRGGLVYYMNNYPDENEVDDKRVKALAFQGNFVTKPTLDRFAYYYHQSDVIEFYALKKGKLSGKISYTCKVAEYTLTDDNTPVILNGHYYFLNGCASNQFVYLLYANPDDESTRPQIAGNTLLVFNWNGKPVKRYDLPVKLTAIAVDPTDSLLYGIPLQPEGALLEFPLLAQ